MKIFDQIKKACLLIAVFAVSLTACNKLELDATPNERQADGATPTLATLLDAPEFSLLKSAAVRAKVYSALGVTSLRYTIFAPDNAAIIASLGVPDEATAAAYLASLSDAAVTGLVSYHVIPQAIFTSSISDSFPNLPYPTILNPLPSASPLLRLTTSPSIRSNGAWVNNIPIIAADIAAVNGVMHKVARIVAPPSTDLWNKITTDPELTYLTAAISRADSGVAAGGRLQDALNTAVNPSAIAANLTVFAPNDVAMKLFLTGALTKGFIERGSPPAQAQAAAVSLVTAFGSLLISNPSSIPDVPGFPPGLGAQIASVLTPTLAKGIVAYHIISSQSGTYAPPGIRIFSVNLPPSPRSIKTLLNSAVAVHPGVTAQATFISIAPGVSVVASATVKGIANATASNLLSMDINTVNGVMHKIDQVLIPQ